MHDPVRHPFKYPTDKVANISKKISISIKFPDGMKLPTGRKNSLTFGSHDGAEVSVVYHTFIETCKMCGVSTLEYFKEFFKAAIKREQFRMYSRNVERELAQVNLKAIMQGRTDYENMLPMTIGIKK